MDTTHQDNSCKIKDITEKVRRKINNSGHLYPNTDTKHKKKSQKCEEQINRSLGDLNKAITS